ncbi:hypothetical protein MBH78_21245 [Oceanimonas sp. NS1]|nr:hypothetical protein [Oceanimonas sp. NS1]
MDKSTFEELSRLNKEDIILYQQASELFTNRCEVEQQGLSYIYGDIQHCNEKSVMGWAFHSQHDDAVTVHVFHNNKLIGEAKSTGLRPGMLRLGLPRNGYIGFHFNFKQPCQTGDFITCKAAETGQILASVTL